MNNQQRAQLEQQIANTLGNESHFVSDEELYRVIDCCLTGSGFARGISIQTRIQLREELYHSFRGYGVISDLLADEEITEIMINNDQKIYYEKHGRLYQYEKVISDVGRLEDVIQRIVAFANRKVNESSPIVDARLPDGSRVNIVMPPVALNSPVITIRKFPQHSFSIKDLISFGMFDETLGELMTKLVNEKKNIFIFGGTGSGKTTLLNALAGGIGREERIITIEDSAELHIEQVENLVRLETRKDQDEVDEISIRDLIKTSLRMRPDRIIVGEIRGAEVLDMLQAMNTGHNGSISTGHGNSAKDMLARMELMALTENSIPLQTVQKLIAAALDIMIEVRRLEDGKRIVSGIYEVVDLNGGDYELKEIYRS